MITTSRKQTVTPRNVEPGQFLEMLYRDSDGELTDRTLLALVYEEDTGLLHALDLEHFTDENLLNTARELARQSQDEKEFQTRFDENSEVFLPEVQDDEVEIWYETEYEARRYEENPYRTFREDRIRSIYEVEVTVT